MSSGPPRASRWAVVVLPLLGACADSPSPGSSSGVGAGVVAPEVRVERAKVQLLLPGDGPPLNEHFELEVLVDGDEPDSVGVDADMPAHRHGMLSAPVVTPLGEGRFRAEGMLLHMPGEWVITVVVTRGGAQERHDFPLDVDFDLGR